MKKGDVFVIIKDMRYSRHRFFQTLPREHQYQYINICDKKRFGKKRVYQLEFFEGPEDVAEKEGLWFSDSFSMREYNRRRAEVPEKYYKWANERILVNLMKNDIIESTTYREIAKRFLDEERM